MNRAWNKELKKWDVTGIPNVLKDTQAYPVGFGRAVARYFQAHGRCYAPSEQEDTDTEEGQEVTIDNILDPADRWEDARMPDVIKFLKGEAEDKCGCQECRG